MGLFSFLKNAGAKVLTKKNAKEVSTPEIKKMEEDILNRQKVILLKGVIDSMGLKVKNLDIDFDGETATVHGEVANQTNREKVVLALGNVGGVSNVDDRLTVKKESKKQAEFYTVKRGDSLSKIAKALYGDPMKYKKIFEANKPMLKDPNLIYPGQTLRIPR
ncbi:MAG: peptidoglycan-binding protein LysM [Saprospiraceae bacterium]